MELTRDMVLHVVKAERLAEKMADLIQCMMSGGGRPWNMADEIGSHLADMLHDISGESETAGFQERSTQILLRSSLDDEHVADEIIRIAKANEPEFPKPNLISRVQFQDMVNKFGGYSAQTPEGEWK